MGPRQRLGDSLPKGGPGTIINRVISRCQPLTRRRPLPQQRASSNRSPAFAQKASYQDFRLPDERLRLRAHGRGARGSRLRADRGCGRGRPRHSQYLPYPGEGGGEGLFRAWTRPPQQGTPEARGPRHADRRGGLRGPGRGRRDHGARAARSISWSGRRAIIASPIWWRRSRSTGKGLVATDFPAEDKFAHLPERPQGKGAGFGVRHRAGRLRQVLHLLRRALYPRRRILSRVRRTLSPRWSGLPRGGAREITLLGQNVNAYHGAGPDGRAVDAREIVAAARANPGDRAAALYHEPSARHGRRR